MEVEEIIDKYGSEGRTGRIIFPHRAYVLVADKFGIDWYKLTKDQQVFLKAEMIDKYARTGSIHEESWIELGKEMKSKEL